MYVRAPHKISKLLIPRWLFSVCLNNLNVLNVISLSLSLSPLFITSYLSLPAENTRALAGCSEISECRSNVASLPLPLSSLPPFLSNFWHALGLQESQYFTKFPFGSWETKDGLWHSSKLSLLLSLQDGILGSVPAGEQSGTLFTFLPRVLPWLEETSLPPLQPR